MARNDLAEFSDAIRIDESKIYRWVILRHADGVYVLKGFVYVGGNWDQDGARLQFNSVTEAARALENLELGRLKLGEE